MRIQEQKIQLEKNLHRRIWVRDITLLAPRPLSYGIFCRFFRLLSPFPLAPHPRPLSVYGCAIPITPPILNPQPLTQK